ncbi:MAG: permease [Firmicutes bacterium]|nr:permease [Bacillota bacterium]
MFTKVLYVVSAFFLAVSLWRDKDRTWLALMKALKAFLTLLPDLSVVLGLVGLILTFLSPDFVAGLIGAETGLFGMLITSVVGAVTLMPGFVAFPLAKSLLDRGAGIMQVTVFVSTLMMVGFVTAPLETRYFNKRITLLRNGLAYLFSFAAAAVVGMVVS